MPKVQPSSVCVRTTFGCDGGTKQQKSSPAGAAQSSPARSRRRSAGWSDKLKPSPVGAAQRPNVKSSRGFHGCTWNRTRNKCLRAEELCEKQFSVGTVKRITQTRAAKRRRRSEPGADCGAPDTRRLCACWGASKPREKCATRPEPRSGDTKSRSLDSAPARPGASREGGGSGKHARALRSG